MYPGNHRNVIGYAAQEGMMYASPDLGEFPDMPQGGITDHARHPVPKNRCGALRALLRHCSFELSQERVLSAWWAQGDDGRPGP